MICSIPVDKSTAQELWKIEYCLLLTYIRVKIVQHSFNGPLLFLMP